MLFETKLFLRGADVERRLREWSGRPGPSFQAEADICCAWKLPEAQQLLDWLPLHYLGSAGHHTPRLADGEARGGWEAAARSFCFTERVHPRVQRDGPRLQTGDGVRRRACVSKAQYLPLHYSWLGVRVVGARRARAVPPPPLRRRRAPPSRPALTGPRLADGEARGTWEVSLAAFASQSASMCGCSATTRACRLETVAGGSSGRL
ncbi:hypothetical protein AB1Y20_012823 [Prymnesium parvum]|uniref:Uncharacterized protein n=1 Tax=Prymnesium parvum TaxID=97485 RepID=A0AB34IJX9_PRYPA